MGGVENNGAKSTSALSATLCFADDMRRVTEEKLGAHTMPYQVQLCCMIAISGLLSKADEQ